VILVDSSVWIDYFNGGKSAAAEKPNALLGVESLAVGDLILAEVLQGFRNVLHRTKPATTFSRS
jgi:predicted nucleic acid-binding protein